MQRTASVAFLVVGLLLALPALHGAQAQEADKATPRAASGMPPISFKVSVVYATQKAGKIDTRTLPLINRMPMKFGSAEVLDERSISVPFGQNSAVPLASGSEIRLLPVVVHQNQLHMQLEMPGVVNTRMRMTSGRPVILGGIPYRDGLLIIQVLPEFSAYLTRPLPRPVGPQTYQIGVPKPGKD